MKKLSPTEKYKQLKEQTEAAGMTVKEVNGKILVRRKVKINEKTTKKS